MELGNECLLTFNYGQLLWDNSKSKWPIKWDGRIEILGMHLILLLVGYWIITPLFDASISCAEPGLL